MKSNEESLESLTERVIARRDKTLKSLGNTVKALAEKARSNAGYETYKTCGDLLSCNIQAIGAHCDSIEVEDYTTGGKRIIALDRKLSPSGNIQAYYDRYQKAKGAWKTARRNTKMLHGSCPQQKNTMRGYWLLQTTPKL